MKTTIIFAALLVAAPVFAALQDNAHGATRHRYIRKNVTKPHTPSRRSVTKKSACAAKQQALALSSSASVSSVSTQSTASTYSTQSAAAAAAATTPAPVPAPVDAPATTTSHYKTTTTTQDQPAQTSQSSSDGDGGYGGGDGSADQYQGGDGTFYSTGLGACGWTNQDTDYIAAVATGTWNEFMTDGNSNDNSLCGRKAMVHYQGKSVEVQLVDLCAGCLIATSLDFSPAAFNVLADPAIGRIHDISWSLM